MVNPIQSGQGPDSVPPGESKAEQQKIAQLQWEINLISTYVTVTEQNSSYGNQIDSLKKDLNSGTSPEKLVPNINQLLQQIDLPSFELASNGHEEEAMKNYAESVKQTLNAVKEKSGTSEENKSALSDLIKQAGSLAKAIGNIPTGEAVDQLNQLIGSANQIIKPYQLQTLGK